MKATKISKTVGLVSTGKSIDLSFFEKHYQSMMKTGDFNMRNNSFGEAIIHYLKVYEILKRGQLPISKEYVEPIDFLNA